MAFTSAINPDVVKTELDDVFMQEFNYTNHPGYADATSELIFNQDSTDKQAEQEEVFKGVSLWGQRSEEQDVPADEPRITNKVTYNVVNFAKSVDISKNFFDDNMHGSYEKLVRDFAEKGRITRDDNAVALYRNAFTSTLTADGATLVSDTHTTISGDTVDNKITAALTQASLNTAIIGLVEQKDQSGVVRGSMPNTLFVPPALFKLASEIVESDLKQGTTDNDMNIYSSKYGIYVATSNRLGAAAGGSDTAWFLLGRNHAIRRWVRQGVVTDLVDYKFQRNNNYIYKGEFREVVGAIDYVGVFGSTGLT